MAPSPGCVTVEALAKEPLDESAAGRERRLRLLVAAAEEEARAGVRAAYASRIVLERERVAADAEAAIEAAAAEGNAQAALLEAAGGDQELLAEVRERVDAAIAASHAEAEEAAEVSAEAAARLAEMTAMTARLREQAALSRGLRALKAAVRRLWALRGVRPEATHVFMADALRLAPFAPAFYEHLKEVRKREGAGQ